MSKNIVPIWLYCEGLNRAYVGYSPNYCILIGRSPRLKDSNHAVVGRPNGYGYQILHDPHPDGSGLEGQIKSVIYLGYKVD